MFESEQKTYCMSRSKSKFDTVDASNRLIEAMEIAINNMIEEIKKPVDSEINGAARKAELQSVKQTAVDCKELIVERQRLEDMIKSMEDTGSFAEEKTFGSGFAESFAKR